MYVLRRHGQSWVVTEICMNSRLNLRVTGNLTASRMGLDRIAGKFYNIDGNPEGEGVGLRIMGAYPFLFQNVTLCEIRCEASTIYPSL